MNLADHQLSSLDLCLIPDQHKTWVATIKQRPLSCFDGCTGNALFAPREDIPRVERGEWTCLVGTRIEAYTTELDALLWQFGHPWMGQPNEQFALIAAPIQEVCAVFNGEIFLVERAQEMMEALPDDCNLHWRSFLARNASLDTLLTFLRTTEVIAQQRHATGGTLRTLQLLGVKTCIVDRQMSCGWGDSLLRIEVQADGSIIARLATAFSVLYGMEGIDDD